MSEIFRKFIQKVGSGVHTGENLTRTEAQIATQMLLQQEATPAQIGAFLIAHRIKRPSPEELAGMLDAYDRLGPQLHLDPLQSDKSVVVLGTPYDGRSRTVPVTPITALILATNGISVISHGGEVMPTKYGIPLVELWQGLGLDFTQLSLVQTQHYFQKTELTFIYLPTHFPLAHALIPYRDQIGKRPPLATVELIWSPFRENAHIIAGFVHPPTEERFQETFALRGVKQFTTIKGLEGSCDLPCSRTAIIGLGGEQPTFERLLLNCRDYGFAPKDVPIESKNQVIELLQTTIEGKPTSLKNSAVFNGGFYLWRCGTCETLADGFEQAEAMLRQGKVAEKLQEIIQVYKG